MVIRKKAHGRWTINFDRKRLGPLAVSDKGVQPRRRFDPNRRGGGVCMYSHLRKIFSRWKKVGPPTDSSADGFNEFGRSYAQGAGEFHNVEQ
jgi:hypothetical protein